MSRSPDPVGTYSSPPPERRAGTLHLNGSGPTGHPAPPDLDLAARAAEADLPTGAEKTALVRSMFDTIAPRYDLVNRMMTFGLDVRWRRQSARALGLPAGARVLDLACGTGDFLNILSAGGLAPLGMDLSWGMLQANRTGLPLAQADGAALPLMTSSVDGITCGYALRNFTELGTVFDEFGRVVRPGGRISLLEVAEPDHGLLLAGHRIWFRKVVPVIGGLLSDRSAYRYLPRSTAYLPGTAELRSMLAGAGFSSVNRRALSGGLSQLITATRTGRP
jgi:demethylmenaquinone methyltransferase/2-methoxy-6-polyprenyl-1,4-benzoquinol methylase